MSPKEGWGTYQGIIAHTAKYGITGTWVCTCDFCHLAVAVRLFPFPNPNKDGSLETSLPCLLYVVYESKHSSPSINGNSVVGPGMFPNSFVATNTL